MAVKRQRHGELQPLSSCLRCRPACEQASPLCTDCQQNTPGGGKFAHQAGGAFKQPGDRGALDSPRCIGAHQAAPMVPRDAPHHPPQPPQDLPPTPPSSPRSTTPPTLPRQLTCTPHGTSLPSLNVEVGLRQPPRLQRPPGQ